MTCEEFQERLAEAALESLEPGGAAALEAHLAAPGPHADCAARLAAARLAAHAPGLALDPVSVPPALWDRIEARLAPPARPRLPRWVPAALAAAVVLAVGATAQWRANQAEADAANVRVAQLTEELRSSQAQRAEAAVGLTTARIECARNLEALGKDLALDAEAIALLEQPGTQVVTFAPQAKHPGLRAVAIVNAQSGKAWVASSGLPTVSGHDYQLWVIRGKAAPIPAGLLSASAAGLLRGQVDAAALGGGPADALAISIEPAGGSRTPTDVALIASLHS